MTNAIQHKITHCFLCNNLYSLLVSIHIRKKFRLHSKVLKHIKLDKKGIAVNSSQNELLYMSKNPYSKNIN